MLLDARRGPAVAATTLALLPGVAVAAALQPSTLLEAPPPVRAGVVLVAVLAVGGVELRLLDESLERAVDTSLARPWRTVGYGVALHLVLIFLGSYLWSQVAPMVSGAIVVTVVGAMVGIALAAVAGFGLTVVGTGVVERVDERDPLRGLVVGAVLGAVVWLVLPLVPAVAVWVLLVSTGVGGPVKEWLVASQTSVDEDPDA